MINLQGLWRLQQCFLWALEVNHAPNWNSIFLRDFQDGKVNISPSLAESKAETACTTINSEDKEAITHNPDEHKSWHLKRKSEICMHAPTKACDIKSCFYDQFSEIFFTVERAFRGRKIVCKFWNVFDVLCNIWGLINV